MDTLQPVILKEIFDTAYDAVNKRQSDQKDQLVNDLFGGGFVNDQLKRGNIRNIEVVEWMEDDREREEVGKVEDTGKVKSEAMSEIRPKEESQVLKNTRNLSKIHLRQIIYTHIRQQTTKLRALPYNHSHSQTQQQTRTLCFHLFSQYCQLFEQLQHKTAHQQLKKQIKKFFINNFVEVIGVMFQKGFRKLLAVMKWVLKVVFVAGFVERETVVRVGKEVRAVVGVRVEEMLPEVEKLAYLLAFKLKGMATPVDFDFQLMKKNQKREKLKKRKTQRDLRARLTAMTSRPKINNATTKSLKQEFMGIKIQQEQLSNSFNQKSRRSKNSMETSRDSIGSLSRSVKKQEEKVKVTQNTNSREQKPSTIKTQHHQNTDSSPNKIISKPYSLQISNLPPPPRSIKITPLTLPLKTIPILQQPPPPTPPPAILPPTQTPTQKYQRIKQMIRKDLTSSINKNQLLMKIQQSSQQIMSNQKSKETKKSRKAAKKRQKEEKQESDYETILLEVSEQEQVQEQEQHITSKSFRESEEQRVIRQKIQQSISKIHQKAQSSIIANHHHSQNPPSQPKSSFSRPSYLNQGPSNKPLQNKPLQNLHQPVSKKLNSKQLEEIKNRIKQIHQEEKSKSISVGGGNNGRRFGK